MKLCSGLGFVVALALGGCLPCEPYASAVCHPAPADRIVGLQVTTTTGNDGSDADFEICVRVAGAAEMCQELDDESNNFQQNARETFDVPVSIEAGDFVSFVVANRGGAVFGNNEIRFAAIAVDAVLVDGTIVPLYSEPTITCAGDVESNQVYLPMSCDYSLDI